MPYPREIAWAKFRVTMVVMCAITILAVLAWLLAEGGLFGARTRLYVYLPDSTGIAEGSPVRVNGIPVGKVRSVELTGANDPLRIVRVVMSVRAEHLRRIPADSTAQVTADTMIGDQLIDISSGKSSQTVAPESEIRFEPPSDFLKSLDIAQFERQLRQVDALLRDLEEGKTPVGEFIKSDRAYRDLLRRVIEVQNGFRSATSTTERVGKLLYTRTLYERLSQPLRELDESLARVQSGQGTAGRMLRDAGDYERFRAGAAELRASLANFRAGRGPGAEWLASDASWNALSSMVDSLTATVDRVNAGPLFTTSATYDNLNGFSRELRDTVRDFRRNPGAYLRIKVF
jgi:phospholipid/cholesterol/gamma-HCH transport system substrate-binding protein